MATMPPLEVLVYEATRQLFDDRYPADLQPIDETTQLEFEPIPDSSASWAEGHCYTLVRGGEVPAYRIALPAAEAWIKLYDNGRAKRFLRSPSIKAIDGVVLLCMARYREQGVRFLPLAEGKPYGYHAEAPTANPEPPPPPVVPVVVRSVTLDQPLPAGPPPRRSQLSMFDEEAA